MNKDGQIPMQVFKAIKRFELAVIEINSSGSKTPNEILINKLEYEGAKVNLHARIRRLIVGKNT